MSNILQLNNILLRMSELLAFGGNARWSSLLRELAGSTDNDFDDVAFKVRGLFGGMGSLNDIVLYRGGKPLKTENDEFDELRERLHELTR